ncbi:hypothetical protein GS498_06410 [Rhodococcus hoagii]|nr:hypothetical protein [Prescottella equi]
MVRRTTAFAVSPSLSGIVGSFREQWSRRRGARSSRRPAGDAACEQRSLASDVVTARGVAGGRCVLEDDPVSFDEGKVVPGRGDEDPVGDGARPSPVGWARNSQVTSTVVRPSADTTSDVDSIRQW